MSKLTVKIMIKKTMHYKLFNAIAFKLAYYRIIKPETVAKYFNKHKNKFIRFQIEDKGWIGLPLSDHCLEVEKCQQ